jgi:DNA invertase Pin-like site-specific DNA recombinase
MEQSRTTKAAIWARVSTDHQHEDNQVPDLERFCAHHGYEVTKSYVLNDLSAFNGAHKATLKAALDDAYRGEYEVIVVWAVDRICRGGIEELLRLIRELRERHCRLVSVQEPWLNGADATTELLAAIAAWVANQESLRRSERIRAGLARRRAEGKPVGGAASRRGQDRKPRATEGYRAMWVARKAQEG